MTSDEFKEIGHTGGKVKFTIDKDAKGNLSYQIGFTHSRPTAAAVWGIYALPQGIPVGEFNLGFGDDEHFPGCFAVMLGSDSQGLFGHKCPKCKGYWRSKGGATICPYCRAKSQKHQLLTNAQRKYVESYCSLLEDALETQQSLEIDMDAVADAVGTDSEKSPFYYSEESQQNKFECQACGQFNDVLGKYAFCCVCGTKNDLQELESRFKTMRGEINESGPYEQYVREAVSAFDTLAASYAKVLSNLPMTQNRRNLLATLNFHNLSKVSERFKTIFDIDILQGVNADDLKFAELMFHRRHVYEHAGGQVDQDYLANSGDNSVRLRQSLHETQASAHRVLNVVLKIASNLHQGFHEILPQVSGPIEDYKQRNRRRNEN